MDFVKREDSNIIEEENYKAYMEATHQMEVTDYRHTAISMEQLHQAMQSSLNASSIVHNFQLPISPRQMSTLMLKSNHITRSLNFNDIPAHVQRNISISEVDLTQPMPNDLPQNLGRHEDLLINQNLARNLDINLARTIANDLELQSALPNSLVQNLSEQELGGSLAPELGHTLNRINDVNLTQGIVRTENIPHNISNEVALSHHLNQQNLEQTLISNPEEGRRTPEHLGTQNLLEQHINQRLEQHLGQRLDHSLAQRLDQRLDQLIAQRMVNAATLHEHQRQLEVNDHLMNMQFQINIKSERDDDGYFYDNINQGVSSSSEVNGHIPLQPEHPQANTTNVSQDVYCVYNNQITPVPALNPIDLYSRQQNYVHNYISNNINRDNPQNLVVHKQFESSSQFPDEFKKLRQDSGGKNDVKNEEPKENLKPSDQNKMYYDYNNSEFPNSAEKNENDASSHNKLSVELAMNIRGEYVCYKCSEIFPSKRALKQHGKICEFANNKESTEKQGKFTCSQCAYRCQSPAILKIHERTHSGEKPYSCTFCDYKSGQKNNVAKHILVHMKEKPFRCQYCDYRCAQKNNLVVHERTHTGYKPFACPYCDYRTVQKPNLVKHMYLHTDQKPFSCDMCSYRCVQKTNLTKHKQRHLNDKGEKLDAKAQTKPYRPRQKSVKCPHCTYRCVQKSSLEKHLQFKHTDVETDFVQLEQRLNLMKHDELCDVQNLSVKKDQCVQEVLEPLQMQS